jgi:hypothetical protein
MQTHDFTVIKIFLEVIPVIGRGGLLGCENSKLPNFLNYGFTDGGEIVGLMHQPLLTPPPRKIPDIHFC